MAIIFRATDHTYWDEETGEEYMSVTRFLGLEEPFDMEEALEKATKSRYGKYKGWEKEKIQKEWDRIRETGTALHKAIEEYIKHQNIQEIEQEHRQAVWHFAQGQWKGKLHSETLLWSRKLRLAGTCDIISEWYDNKTEVQVFSIFDVKTSSSLDYKMEKFSKQMWLYAFMLEECLQENEKKDKEMLGETEVETVKRKIKASGIIHYKDYLHNRKEKPTFVAALDMKEYVTSLYKKNTPAFGGMG